MFCRRPGAGSSVGGGVTSADVFFSMRPCTQRTTSSIQRKASDRPYPSGIGGGSILSTMSRLQDGETEQG